ncbi:hypothetical protein FANTH_10794 [Fusarium anthophilum]|uniref:Uncharacterized protein n=1 Tax=Fusarium anthophilum TaxID=48485 RepID=A0A8H4YZJ0_9HYPO|nr:hypothetical protein FANTH_10794 [Fusarium anthophilum]
MAEVVGGGGAGGNSGPEASPDGEVDGMTDTNAIVPHLWRAAKWSAMQKADLFFKDLRRILRSDSAMSAIKSLLVSPVRARLVALFYFALRLGPAFGFSLLFGEYTLQCYKEGGSYPWPFRRTAIHFGCCRLAFQAHPTPAAARDNGLDKAQRFRAVRGDIDGQLVLEFAPCDPVVSNPPETAGARALVLSTNYKGSFLLSHTMNVVPLMVCSLLIAIGIQVWMQTVNVRGRYDANVCLPMDQIFGYPGARIALNILVILYGIFTATCFEQMMHIYRWSVFHHNPIDLILLENLFQGHFLWPYSRFRHLPVLGGRAFTTGMLGTLATRLCIGVIPPLALLTGWDSGERSSQNRGAIFALTWITFNFMLASGLVVVLLTRRDYVPDDDLIITAVVMQDLVEIIHQTNSPVLTESMKIGSVDLNGAVDGAAGIPIFQYRYNSRLKHLKSGFISERPKLPHMPESRGSQPDGPDEDGIPQISLFPVYYGWRISQLASKGLCGRLLFRGRKVQWQTTDATLTIGQHYEIFT